MPGASLSYRQKFELLPQVDVRLGVGKRVVFLLVLIAVSFCDGNQGEVEIYLGNKLGIEERYPENISDFISCNNCLVYLVHPNQCYACLNELLEYLIVGTDSLKIETRVLLIDTGNDRQHFQIFESELNSVVLRLSLTSFLKIWRKNETQRVPTIGLYTRNGKPVGHFVVSNTAVTSIAGKFEVLGSLINHPSTSQK